MKYKDVDYTRQRLDGTVIRINDQVVYIDNIDGWQYSVFNLLTREEIGIDLRGVHIDLNPIPLGYINHRGISYYLSRVPMRKWKQGLSSEALLIKDPCGRVKVGITGSLLKSSALGNCVNNKYPSFKEAYDNVLGGYISSEAFSRVFSLSKGTPLKLYYKTKEVGYITEDGLELSTRYEFLKEMLEECIK